MSTVTWLYLHLLLHLHFSFADYNILLQIRYRNLYVLNLLLQIYTSSYSFSLSDTLRSARMISETTAPTALKFSPDVDLHVVTGAVLLSCCYTQRHWRSLSKRENTF